MPLSFCLFVLCEAFFELLYLFFDISLQADRDREAEFCCGVVSILGNYGVTFGSHVQKVGNAASPNWEAKSRATAFYVFEAFLERGVGQDKRFGEIAAIYGQSTEGSVGECHDYVGYGYADRHYALVVFEFEKLQFVFVGGSDQLFCLVAVLLLSFLALLVLVVECFQYLHECRGEGFCEDADGRGFVSQKRVALRHINGITGYQAERNVVGKLLESVIG